MTISSAILRLDEVRIARIEGYSRIETIRNNNVHPNNIFAIRNSENNYYFLFFENIGIATIRKCEKKKNIYYYQHSPEIIKLTPFFISIFE